MADIEYLLERRDRRTLSITVRPDGTVLVRAPLSARDDEIERRVERRMKWIRARRADFEAHSPRTPPRRFVPGESHRFLGRNYRLRVIEGDGPACLVGPYLEVPARDASPDTLRRRIESWYRAEAALLFPPMIDAQRRRFGYLESDRPRLVVKKLTRRWGSLSSGGILTLNLDLVKAPRSCVEYVICHELCHLRHRDHGPAFYARLQAMLPDWEARKRRLERALL